LLGGRRGIGGGRLRESGGGDKKGEGKEHLAHGGTLAIFAEQKSRTLSHPAFPFS
jgi:hypothetical protein